ncbi:peptidoglycan DD-metalloendopeptidase family protein [Candidatus Parcubacteria bacterium]|nr:peptidoglycan DD-metalloendopeptidase family protein [Candidatus Parcubacteria bacterium]
MKKLLAILVTLISLTLFSLAGRTFADTVSDLQTKIQNAQVERKALQEEQKRLQAEIDTAAKSGASLQTTIKSLEAAKNKISNDLKITQTNINETNFKIQELTSNIDTKQKQISIHLEAISQGLKRLSDYERSNLLSDMLVQSDLSTLWEDKDSLISIQGTLDTEIHALQDAQKELGQEKEDKETKKAELGSLKTLLSGQKTAVEDTQTSKTKLLIQTKSEEISYRKLLLDNQAREKQFEDLLFQYESQLKVALDPSSFPSAKHSVLNWPIQTVKITQQFGKTSSSGRLYASGTHNGVDFGTPVGSIVATVASGVVKGQGNTDTQPGCYSYGRWILIEHDNGLSSIYGHLGASTVATGQKVAQGDIIGYSGGAPGAFGSGYSTGPHLHLGLYATQAVEIQTYSSSINCKNVAIPLAHPQGYLDPLAYLPSL